MFKCELCFVYFRIDLADAILTCPLTDQAIVAQHIGTIYPLVFLELGVEFRTIDAVRSNERNIEQLVQELLNRWCQNNPDNNSVGRVLNVMRQYGLPTTEVEKRIRKRHKVG